MCLMCVGNVVPLLNHVLQALDYSKLTNEVDALHLLYNFLLEKSPEFDEACTKAVREGVRLALKFLLAVLNKIVQLCNENRLLITDLSKLATKAPARSRAITVGMKIGAGKAASQSVKAVLKFTNPAHILCINCNNNWPLHRLSHGCINVYKITTITILNKFTLSNTIKLYIAIHDLK